MRQLVLKTDTLLVRKLALQLLHTGLAQGIFIPSSSNSVPLTLTNVPRGGPNTAVSITNDQQWTGFKNALHGTPKSVVEIRIILKSNDLNQWRRSAMMTVHFLIHP